MKDRRFSARTPEHLQCTVEYKNKIYNCIVIDISRDGIAITSKDLKPDIKDSIKVIYEDRYHNTFYGDIIFENTLLIQVVNVTQKDKLYRIGARVHNEDFAKYVDDKQAHYWFKEHLESDKLRRVDSTYKIMTTGG